MAVQRTFSIIKPDATARNITGKVNAKIEEAGLRIVAQKRVQLTEEQAGGFYAVHKERPFYADLVKFMMSGPVVVQVLEGERAQRTQPKPMPELFALNLLRASMLTQFMDLMPLKQRQKKLSSFSLRMK